MTSTEAAVEINRIYEQDDACDFDEHVAAVVQRAIDEAFRAGFEHAVAGGEEASKRVGLPRENLPLVLYFNDEADRSGFVQMVKDAIPGLKTISIPERA